MDTKQDGQLRIRLTFLLPTLLIGILFFTSKAYAATEISFPTKTDNITAVSVGTIVLDGGHNLWAAGTVSELQLHIKVDVAYPWVGAEIDFNNSQGNPIDTTSWVCAQGDGSEQNLLIDFSGNPVVLTTSNPANYIVMSQILRSYDTEAHCLSHTSPHTLNTLYGQSTAPATGFHFYPYSGSPYNFIPYMVGGDALTPTRFTYPTEGSFVQLGSGGSLTFTGTCPTNGSNKIALLPGTPETFRSPTSESFVITCTNHTWSSTITETARPDNYSAYDVSYLSAITGDNHDHVNYTAYITSLYSLAIDYPSCPSSFCNNLAPGDWTFRISYRIPVPTTDASLEIFSDCTDTFDTNDCSTTLVNNTFSVVDPDNNEYVDVTPIGVGASTNYFIAQIVDESTGTVVFKINFRTLQDTSSTALPLQPPGQDLGFWGNLIVTLFMPTHSQLTAFNDNLIDVLRGKIPFGYYFAITDQIDTTNTNTSPLVVTVPIHIANTNYSWPLINSSDTSISAVGDTFRPYLITALWLAFAWYVYSRIRDHEL